MEDSNLNAAILGGGIALAGSLSVQMLVMWAAGRHRRHERDIRQRERLERPAEAVGEVMPWYQQLAACRDLESIASAPPPASARRAAVLARLYFPRLAETAADFSQSLLRLHHYAVDLFEPESPLSLGGQMARLAQMDPAHKDLLNESFQKRLALDDAIFEEARRLSHT